MQESLGETRRIVGEITYYKKSDFGGHSGTIELKNGNRYSFLHCKIDGLISGEIGAVRDAYYEFELKISSFGNSFLATNIKLLRKKDITELDLPGIIEMYTYDKAAGIISGFIKTGPMETAMYPFNQKVEHYIGNELKKGKECTFRIRNSTHPNFEFDAYIIV